MKPCPACGGTTYGYGTETEDLEWTQIAIRFWVRCTNPECGACGPQRKNTTHADIAWDAMPRREDKEKKE